MGSSHTINQDAVAYRSPDAFVIADGVGGGAWGEVASDMLAKGLAALYLPDEIAVNNCILELDAAIAQHLTTLGDAPGASVMAGLWRTHTDTNEYLASWVGDCQLSHWRCFNRAWTLSWQSKEQSYESMGLPPPLGIPPQSPANMIGCGLGFPVSHMRFVFKTADRIVISSDGFWRAVSTQQIDQFMNQFPFQLPDDAAKQLCDLALHSGSQDDISVLVIENLPLSSKPLFTLDNVALLVLTFVLLFVFVMWPGGITI